MQKEIDNRKQDTYGALINKRGNSDGRIVGGRWERIRQREKKPFMRVLLRAVGLTRSLVW